MTHRVQVLLEPEERELFRSQASSEGMSLSAWLRQAGRERLARCQSARHIATVDDLREFFAACDAREQGREPDWSEHRAAIERSIADNAVGP